MGKKPTLVRFSDHFNLNKSQPQLDFVDIPMETDISLYVDPYALHVASQDWLRECGNNVVTYFEMLVEKIRAKDDRVVNQLLDNFHEVNETHLGQSKGKPSGRGWGPKQSKELYKVLKSSAVVQTGELSDLGDYEMFIPGIGPDKISDLATNIIKAELVQYTNEQCELWGVPTQSSPCKFWDVASGNFVSCYVELPVYNDNPIILVPKSAVRMRLIPSRDSFYSRVIIQYLKAEHLSANDSLVTVLKNGKKKVYVKDLKEKYPFNSQQIYDFAKRHPELLQQYKKSLPNEAKPISDHNIEWRQKERRQFEITDYVDQLNAIRPGHGGASAYHNLIMGILQAIFYPQLSRPVKEKPADDGRKRIDIKFDNGADKGFFSHLINRHKYFAPYIFVECKNYSEDPENPEFSQLQSRFSRKRGQFGILVCRTIDKPELLLKRCKDVVNNTDGAIMVLDDEDVVELLRRKATQGDSAVSDYLEEKLEEILF